MLFSSVRKKFGSVSFTTRSPFFASMALIQRFACGQSKINLEWSWEMELGMEVRRVLKYMGLKGELLV